MRIAICGTHSTGKSVLLDACMSALELLYPGRVSAIAEVAREIIADGFPLNQHATTDSYINYVLRQLAAERRVLGNEYIVSDRCLFDLLAYMRTNKDPRVPGYLISMVEEVAWLEQQFFDMYCYIPIEFPLQADEVRPIQEDYRAAVDKTLLQVFRDHAVVPVVLTGSVHNRKEAVLQCCLNRDSMTQRRH
jgi:hypothetical protein